MITRKICGCKKGDACSDCNFDILQQLHYVKQQLASDPNNQTAHLGLLMLEGISKELKRILN